MEVIKSSVLFRSLGSQHLGVEVWPDPDAPDAGETYFWVVSRFGEGNVRILAYVRVGTGRLEPAPTTRPATTCGCRRSKGTPNQALQPTGAAVRFCRVSSRSSGPGG